MLQSDSVQEADSVLQELDKLIARLDAEALARTLVQAQ
jgi:hypothetical protein